MRVLMWPTATALLIAVGLLSVPAANAQVQSPSPGLSDQSSNISDQKLDAVATAIERVASLKQDYQQRIAAAAPSDKERIANDAINALAKAVTDQGLSLEEYDSILEVAQNDPEVREKFVSAFVLRPSSRSSSRCEGFAGATVTLQHLNTQLALGQPIDLSQHAQAVSAMVRVGSRFGLQRRHFSRQNARQRTTLGPRFCFTVPNLPIG